MALSPLTKTLRMDPVNGSPLVEFRVHDMHVERRANRGAWERLTRAQILAYPSDGLVWEWLREMGIVRPSPSGATIPEGERTTWRVRLPADVKERAEKLAKRWGCDPLEAVARAVRDA